MSERPRTTPVASPETGYYGLPVLKAPVWSWEIPTYIFVGGIAGPAAIIAAAAHGDGDGRGTLGRDAQWIAAAGGMVSAVLLIADLGRPERFLHMLRVFKPRSPMSVGSWVLMAFSSTTSAAACTRLLAERTRGGMVLRLLDRATRTTTVFGAISGSVLATYTGVLIGSTAIPVWHANARLLPMHFGAAGLGSSASVLELIGHDEPALHRLALAAALVETLAFAGLEADQDPRLRPLKIGASGAASRLASLLTGPLPLVLRLLGGRSRGWRRAAAVSSLVGSFLSRLAWIAAGRASARDPRVPLQLDRASVDHPAVSVGERLRPTDGRD